MINPPHLSNEAERLKALSEYRMLGTKPEQTYDDITEIAARVCEAPIALISLVDSERQWFKSKVGTDVEETPRDWSFCAHAIEDSEPLIVEDALADHRFADNPLVKIAEWVLVILLCIHLLLGFRVLRLELTHWPHRSERLRSWILPSVIASALVGLLFLVRAFS